MIPRLEKEATECGYKNLGLKAFVDFAGGYARSLWFGLGHMIV